MITMEQASIHKLLVSIPSRASNFALACMSEILKDQIQDPRRMANNLKRIGSAVSDWGLALSGEIDAAGDAGNLYSGDDYENGTNVNPTLLNLPTKIRYQIWSYLGSKDLLSLRLVCSKVQFDCDIGVGLPVIMDTTCESIKWLQSITTRECFVKHLDNFLYFNFLPKPQRMEGLQFHQYIIVSKDMLDLVLRKFGSLRKMTFHSQELLEVVNATEIQPIRPSITTELLSVLEQRGRLTGISLQFNEITLTTKWSLEWTPQSNFPSEKTNLSKVHLKIPGKQLHQQKDCLQYLERRTTITDLRIDLGGIFWEQYMTIVNQNAKTLTTMCLLNISSIGSPFDCTMLTNCSNLSMLLISGEIDVNQTGGFSYLPIVEVRALALPKLQAIQLENVYISMEDYGFVKYELSKTVWMKKCLCGDEQVFEAKTGFGRIQNPWSRGMTFNKLQEGWENDEDQSDNESSDHEFDDDEEISPDYYGCDNAEAISCASNLVNKMIQGIPVEIMKGLFLTAWIAFC